MLSTYTISEIEEHIANYQQWLKREYDVRAHLPDNPQDLLAIEEILKEEYMRFCYSKIPKYYFKGGDNSK